jgi:uncharacterized membrane protein
MQRQISPTGLPEQRSSAARPPHGWSEDLLVNSRRAQDQATDGARIFGLIVLQFLVLQLAVFLTLKIANPVILAGDMRKYYRWALWLMEGQVPYRDFPVEYPPLALVSFLLPYLLASGRPMSFPSYVLLFRIEIALLSTLMALALVRVVSLWRPSRNSVQVLLVYVLFVAAAGPLLTWRYDIFPALLTLLALALVLAGRPAWAGFCIGFGILAKLYPIVLLPIFCIYYVIGKQRGSLISLLLGTAGAVVVSLLPVLVLAPETWRSFLGYHQLRGLQVESLPAGAILLGRLLGVAEARLVVNFGAIHLISPISSIALQLQPFLQGLAFSTLLVSCVARFWHERSTIGGISSQTLVAYLVAALLAFIATNKVFSPQYLFWLLPFAPLLRPWHAGLLLVICVMTALGFPFNYAGLIRVEVFPVLLLNLRNLLVVVLMVWLLVDHVPSLVRIPSPERPKLRRWFAGQGAA